MVLSPCLNYFHCRFMVPAPFKINHIQRAYSGLVSASSTIFYSKWMALFIFSCPTQFWTNKLNKPGLAGIHHRHHHWCFHIFQEVKRDPARPWVYNSFYGHGKLLFQNYGHCGLRISWIKAMACSIFNTFDSVPMFPSCQNWLVTLKNQSFFLGSQRDIIRKPLLMGPMKGKNQGGLEY